MRIKLKYPDVETFIQKYAVNISRGGIFIATKTPKAVGTPLKFEFLLAVGEAGISVIRGEGQVLWTREFDPNQPGKAHGMGVKFTRLDAESQAIVDRALAYRAQQQTPADARRDEQSQPAIVIPRRDEQSQPAIVIPPRDEHSQPAIVIPPHDEQSQPAIVIQPPPPQPQAAPPKPPPVPPQPPPRPPAAGRAPNEVTRPLPVESARTPTARGREDVTRPITVEQAEAEITKETALPPPKEPEAPRVKVALERDPSREVRIRGGSRGAAMAELEEMAREWGVDEQQIERILKRRRPRMVEATAELERLLRKPARPPTPSRAEALAGLRELLQRRAPVLEIDRRPQSQSQTQAQAAGGESEPVIKKAR
jgi:uncharacterized protein (TIGR02266 family)